MTDQLCVRCDQPTPDGYTCHRCAVDRPTTQLTEIADLTPAARDVARGQIRHSAGGGGGGKPGSRPPINVDRTDELEEVHGALELWCGRIARYRGILPPWYEYHGDPIIAGAEWLTRHLEWARHRLAFADFLTADFLTAIDKAAHTMRGIVNGPGSRRYLGPCGAPDQVETTTIGDPEPTYMDGAPCDGDVYGPDGGRTGTCRTCHTSYSQHDRRAWFADITRDRAYRAAHIADAYGISVKTIRSWADRGRLTAWWADGDQLVQWIEPETGEDVTHRGPRLFVIGDVLALAEADAHRREQQRIAREQRAAAQPAEMGA
ncbi:hypothetical protein OHA21_43770 [Actinoplanes sp. NBC_00393]|uniref:hypothetical protein n=1 Tax=Actinoplanes sp. NBC_00393 TaxID=2975953 RepID=UPI002E22BB62